MRGFVVAAILSLSGGCYVYGGVHAQAAMVVYEEPPAPRIERAPQLPAGYVWVGGHWESHDSQWSWVAGRAAPVRGGYVWTDGRWERRGNSWHWVEGTWTAAATTASGG